MTYQEIIKEKDHRYKSLQKDYEKVLLRNSYLNKRLKKLEEILEEITYEERS